MLKIRSVCRLIFIIPVLVIGCTIKQNTQSTHQKGGSIRATRSISKKYNREFIVDADNNIWQRRDRFQIKLPKGYFISHAIIHSADSSKVGEIVLDSELLKSPLTNLELFAMIKDYLIIETTETAYGYSQPIDPNEVGKRLVLDSTTTYPQKWFYEISQMEWESAEDWGVWNVFSFHTIRKDRITVINFYNKNLEDLSIDKYLPILNSVKFIK